MTLSHKELAEGAALMLLWWPVLCVRVLNDGKEEVTAIAMTAREQSKLMVFVSELAAQREEALQ